MEGTVDRVNPDKKFGFIRRQGMTDMHFLYRNYPAGHEPVKGDVVEFDVHTDSTKPAGKNETATNIRLVSAATSTNVAPATAAATISTTPEFYISFEFEEPEQEVDRWDMEVRVVVTDKDGKPVRGAAVDYLKFGGYIANDPAESIHTDADGKATYIIRYMAQAGSPLQVPKKILLAAQVSHMGQTATMSTMWPPKPVSQPAPTQTPVVPVVAISTVTPATADPNLPSVPPTTLTPNRLTVQYGLPNRDGWILATVGTYNNDSRCCGDFTFCSSETVQVKDGFGKDIGSGNALSMKTDSSGFLTFTFTFKGSQTLVWLTMPNYETGKQPVTRAGIQN